MVHGLFNTFVVWYVLSVEKKEKTMSSTCVPLRKASLRLFYFFLNFFLSMTSVENHHIGILYLIYTLRSFWPKSSITTPSIGINRYYRICQWLRPSTYRRHLSKPFGSPTGKRGFKIYGNCLRANEYSYIIL